eukprot:TRINITY_DN9824_c0_g1_i4.p1 TRINITY_DN9824_c0_g1~~TRINITY_DN9824_c0_g1_i4.p1  ORF type:complete len:387 (+),score=63.98 TRINITY_DN9824_c0_g1_i4:49-1209(+)
MSQQDPESIYEEILYSCDKIVALCESQPALRSKALKSLQDLLRILMKSGSIRSKQKSVNHKDRKTPISAPSKRPSSLAMDAKPKKAASSQWPPSSRDEYQDHIEHRQSRQHENASKILHDVSNRRTDYDGRKSPKYDNQTNRRSEIDDRYDSRVRHHDNRIEVEDSRSHLPTIYNQKSAGGRSLQTHESNIKSQDPRQIEHHRHHHPRSPIDEDTNTNGQNLVSKHEESRQPQLQNTENVPIVSPSRPFLSALASMHGGPTESEVRLAQEKKELMKREWEEQIRQKKEREAKEKERLRLLEEKEEKELRAYNPFGRGGAGAPLRDERGNLMTSRRPMLVGNDDPSDSRSSDHDGISPKHAGHAHKQHKESSAYSRELGIIFYQMQL